MESSTSNYLSTLHVLLHKLSSEVYRKNSTGTYPNIHSFNSSKNLISAIQEVDSFIISTDRSLRGSGEFSEDISKSTTNDFSRLHLFVNGYTISILAVMGLIINLIGILLLSTGPRRDKVLNLLVACRLSFDASFLLCELLKGKVWFKEKCKWKTCEFRLERNGVQTRLERTKSHVLWCKQITRLVLEGRKPRSGITASYIWRTEEGKGSNGPPIPLPFLLLLLLSFIVD